MALNATTLFSIHPKPSILQKPKYLHFSFPFSPTPSSSFLVPALSEGTEGGLSDQEYSGSSSARTQLDLLQQLTSSGPSDADGYQTDGSNTKLTIRDQLAQLVGNRDDDFTIPLGKNLKKVSPKFLTISQKRNIKRQTYLNEVSRRNDSTFFATIGACPSSTYSYIRNCYSYWLRAALSMILFLKFNTKA